MAKYDLIKANWQDITRSYATSFAEASVEAEFVGIVTNVSRDTNSKPFETCAKNERPTTRWI